MTYSDWQHNTHCHLNITGLRSRNRENSTNHQKLLALLIKRRASYLLPFSLHAFGVPLCCNWNGVQRVHSRDPTVTDQPEPKQTSFLLNRAKAAKAKAAAKPSNDGNRKLTATSSLQTVPKAELSPTEKHPTRQPTTQSGKAATQKIGETLANQWKTDDDRAPPAASLDLIGDADTRILELFAQHSPNKLAFELLRPDLPGIIRALIRGAQIVGIRGHQDRMTCFRMMGVPWTPTGGGGGIRGEANMNLDAMADRIARAVNRREGRLLGHEPVTVDVEPEPEPAEVLPEPA